MRCKECGHQSHGAVCYNMASDNDCECKFATTPDADRIEASPHRMAEAIELAERFHATYELLAPQFGYNTRPDTKEFDVTTPNGKLMVAVCISLLDYADERTKILSERNADLTRRLAAAMEGLETVRGRGMCFPNNRTKEQIKQEALSHIRFTHDIAEAALRVAKGQATADGAEGDKG